MAGIALAGLSKVYPGSVRAGSEPEIGTEVWLTPVPGRALLYRAGDGELVEAATTVSATTTATS